MVELFQRLHTLYPAFSRFQLELAQSQLQAELLTQARDNLEYLSNDLELGEIAQQMLQRLDENGYLEYEKYSGFLLQRHFSGLSGLKMLE